MNRLKSYAILFFMVLIPPATLASHRSQSIGDIARSLDRPVMGIVELVRAVCLIAGVGMVVGSLIKYKQHRRNPIEVSLGSVFAILLAGLALIALTFIPVFR